jgi:SAM-dependent methyltransferase
VTRDHAFAEERELTFVDRLGVWLSRRSISRVVGSFDDRRIADVGCGFHATLTRSILDAVAHATVLDVSLADDLIALPKVTALVGPIEATLPTIPDASIDVVLCVSVLEHLRDDRWALAQFRRIMAPGATLVVNVPSWRGKFALETSAFRFGLSPVEEMDDHKRYYDPRDLWPLLVEAGFVPHNIRCRRHKFGINTLAVCRLDVD